MISLRSLRIKAFARDSRGAAAIEFALVTPLMLTMYFGMVELSSGVAIDRKVTMVSHTLSDLVAQTTAVSNADISNVFNASSAMMTPYLATPLTAKVTEVSIDNTGKATVTCSRAWTSGGGVSTGYTQNAVVTSSIPAGLIVSNWPDLVGSILRLHADHRLRRQIGGHAVRPVLRPPAPVDQRGFQRRYLLVGA